MADQRAHDALRRIERAIARIEAAASRPAPPRSAEDFEEFVRLRAAHEALREQVTGALGEVDRLLASGGPG
jgi:hypothetical protein